MDSSDASRPLIFITNDDSISASGLRYLIDSVMSMGDIVVMAPDSPQSGKSSAITVDAPIRIFAHADRGSARMYSASGTPVDCVKLGNHTLLHRKPDLLLSGINHGSNSACNLLYSGTMGAVIEGALLGIPSIGFSLLDHSPEADFSYCGNLITNVVGKVIANGLPSQICLNINIPAHCKPHGIKVTRGAMGYWTDEYTAVIAPDGKTEYRLSGRFVNEEPDNPDTDNYWLDRGYATIVPVHPDQSYIPAISPLKDLFE